MPLMNVLQTDLNFLDVEFIKHLANEKFVFEKFFL